MPEEPDPLQSLMADILEAEFRGEPVDRDVFVNQHPEHEDSLRKFFANHDSIKAGSHTEDVTLPPANSGPVEDATLPTHRATAIVDTAIAPQKVTEGSALPPSQPLTNYLGRVASYCSLSSLPFWLMPVAFNVFHKYIFGVAAVDSGDMTFERLVFEILGGILCILALLCAGSLSLLGLIFGLAGLRDQPRLAARCGVILALTGPGVLYLLFAIGNAANLFSGLIRGGWIFVQIIVVYWIVHRLYFHKRDTAELRSSLPFIILTQLAALTIASTVAESFQFSPSYFHLCLYAVATHWLAILFVCTEEHVAHGEWNRVVIRWGLLLGFILAITDSMVWNFTAFKS